MVPVFTQQALEACGAQAVFAEGLDVFHPVDFAF